MSLEYNELEPIIEKICEKIRTLNCNFNLTVHTRKL